MCPSTTNGIVGIKPTIGLVSRSGIVPVSHTQDTAGPMARTVGDAAILLAALTEDGVGPVLDPDALRGARIGVARNMAGFHDRVDAVFEDALDALRVLGAEVVDPADVPHADDLEGPEWEVLSFEFKADLEMYLSGLSGSVPRTISDLIAFNYAHADDEMPFFGQERFERSAEKGPLTEPAYVEALATCGRLARHEGLDAVFSEHRLEAVVAPTGAPAWLTDHVNGDHDLGGNSSPAAVAGYPSLTVPMGFVAGLPVGMSFIGRPRGEGRLIGFGFAFERSTTHRRPPRFLPSLDGSR
jgi:amidase